MAPLLLWLSLAAAGISGVVTYGGPPPLADDQLPGLPVKYQLSRASQDAESLDDLDQLLETYIRGEAGTSRPVQAPITMDDVDRADVEMHPPLRYSLPERFRLYELGGAEDGLRAVAAEAAAAAVAEASAADAHTATSANGVKGLLDWLPHLPSLSSLMPHLPSYIPGINLEAEVHRQPTPIKSPHIFTPTEILQHITKSIRDAVEKLHQKQRQLAELIECSCPRPARCEGLLQSFMGKPYAIGSAPSSAPGIAPGTTLGAALGTTLGTTLGTAPDSPSSEPQLSLFAGLTKPGGQTGPGFGFYVDKNGPHLGHHIHHAAASSSATSAASSQASALSQSSALSQALASGHATASASNQASASSQALSSGHATASASSQASGHAAASASGLASASSSGLLPAIASSNSVASAGSPYATLAAAGSADASVGSAI